MRVVGVIAEYNPFHRGHAYHLARAREISRADFVMVFMSGNYVQRGIPAMFDKYTRAEAALQNGADLVLELPLCAASGSAEYFALGAVSLLLATGVVTDLCFGSECGNLGLLEKAARILAFEPEEYKNLLQKFLRSGESFPKARSMALLQYEKTFSEKFLENPNNLLGIEYLKALKRLGGSVQVHTIQRRGAGYHDFFLPQDCPASASGIRSSLIRNHGFFTPEISMQLPSADLYADYHGKTPLTEDAFSLLLLEKLRRIQGDSLDQYFDVPEELSNRIWNLLDKYASFSQFADLLKTRNMTRSAICRALLHILLDVYEFKPAGSLQVLGFRKEAAGLLRAMSTAGILPILTAPLKGEDAKKLLYADRLYESVRSMLHGTPYQNEYRRKMLVIK